jgi:transketolase
MQTDAMTDSLQKNIETTAGSLDGMPIEQLSIHTIRTLAIDAVQAANSGHPGAPMALAPVAYLLSRQMRHNPGNPDWFDRDRFVLSAGHASMLLYAMLHLSGYELPLEELKQFRQLGSMTPGHPEVGHTPGVETTTGPLGQGLMNAVGMAMAEAHLAAVYNKPEHRVVDHFVYVVCSDGDLMEGASHEAGSLAGHLGLGKLIVVYDDNRITIDGPTDLAWSDDVPARFESYGWHIQHVGDANDLPALAGALETARDASDRPSLIVVRSHIGYGSPNKQDTASAHGSPLGPDEVALTKRAYGWPEDSAFLVPEAVSKHMGDALTKGRAAESAWLGRMTAYRQAYPELAADLEASIRGTPPDGWADGLPEFEPGDGSLATRAASGRALQAAAEAVPWLMGGSADLAPSNNTVLPFTGDFASGAWENRNVRWGVREHVMCSAANGMALHGGVRPYVATFLVFTDYARPALRLAALMGQPVIYVMTHDSIGLGEDGPTHQPVEHLAALRAIPGLVVIRPADANETVEAWRSAIERADGPTLLALTRQKLPVLARQGGGVARGGYILADSGEAEPDVILIATGSEVCVALEAREQLARTGVHARVVSLPSWELFREQSRSYRDSVLPPSVNRRIAIEAGIDMGWREWIGDHGMFIGMAGFGASAPGATLFEHFGITAEAIVRSAEQLLAT